MRDSILNKIIRYGSILWTIILKIAVAASDLQELIIDIADADPSPQRKNFHRS